MSSCGMWFTCCPRVGFLGKGRAGGDDIITGAWPEDVLPGVCMHWGPDYCMEGLGEVARVAWANP